MYNTLQMRFDTSTLKYPIGAEGLLLIALQQKKYIFILNIYFVKINLTTFSLIVTWCSYRLLQKLFINWSF